MIAIGAWPNLMLSLYGVMRTEILGLYKSLICGCDSFMRMPYPEAILFPLLLVHFDTEPVMPLDLQVDHIDTSSYI